MKAKDARIGLIYDELLHSYGAQGWWPLLSCKSTNPTKTGAIKGYHCGDYTYPRTRAQQFEICIGAILTQNTAWPNVEKALQNLKKRKLLDPKKIIDIENNSLEEAIRPAGYYRQKAKKLKIFSQFFLALKDRVPAREELLALWGVGPETADSMLLYAFRQPSFVVDAYTRRILEHLKMIRTSASYDEIKQLFEKSLPREIALYQEFHALIVEHAKRHYARKPYACPLERIIAPA